MKFKLIEGILTSFGNYFLYENPTSKELHSKEDSKWNRGIIDNEGNLYIEAKWIENEKEYQKSLDDYLYSEWTHSELLSKLHDMNKFDFIDSGWRWSVDPEYLKIGVFVQRHEDSLNFYLAESYDKTILPNVKKAAPKFFKLAKKKNPQIIFHNERIHNIKKGW